MAIQHKQNEKTWTTRFKHLKASGFTKQQAEVVFEVLQDCRAFHYDWVEQSAKKQFEEVFK